VDPNQRQKIQQEFASISRAHWHRAPSRAARQARLLAAWIRPHENDLILDAACGAGSLARVMARAGARVTGIDLCPQMVRLAKETPMPNGSAPRPTFAIGNVELLPYANGHFSLTTCTNSFANYPDPLQVLRELARVTHHQGRIIVADVIAPEDPAKRTFLNCIEGLRGHIYTRILKHSEFLTLFREAGLRLVSSQLHRRSQRFHEWLRLSPAASRHGRARRLRRLILASAEGDGAGLRPRTVGREIILHYLTEWFLLQRVLQ